MILDKDVVEEKPTKLSEMYTMISRRKLLYSAPAYDLTNEVIERLDILYEKSKP